MADLAVSCLCPTYNRPQVLPEAIECFLRQTYPLELRELVILDDANQYAPKACEHLPNVRLHVTDKRYPTLGEKRNALAKLAKNNIFILWDDDDIYLPRHIEILINCFKKGARWVLPANLYTLNRYRKGIRANPAFLFHAAGGFTRELFDEVRGYPVHNQGEDQLLMKKFRSKSILPMRPSEPTFIYRWYSYPGAKHISVSGTEGYKLWQRKFKKQITKIEPFWRTDYVALVKDLKIS